MKKIVQHRINVIATLLEIVFSVICIIILIILSFLMLKNMMTIEFLTQEGALNIFLNTTLFILIGFEFLRMLMHPTAATIVDVILFSTARQIIISHNSIYETLVGIACIFALFSVRKYLLCRTDTPEPVVFKGIRNTSLINRLLRTNIPGSNGEDLAAVMTNNLDQRNQKIVTGAIVVFESVILRVKKMRDNQIDLVEIIKLPKQHDFSRH
ncbi:hypothetical protein SAMN04488579_12119 [Eubacterium barkeri]|uniref:Transporter n=1 Tax=Eubacterium barkeri TaxID=1528 RepID=A0A1H3I5V8_EUBBA|nr:hypothetical protein SAMN04488579_12119 [Eubacterium barkeri]